MREIAHRYGHHHDHDSDDSDDEVITRMGYEDALRQSMLLGDGDGEGEGEEDEDELEDEDYQDGEDDEDGDGDGDGNEETEWTEEQDTALWNRTIGLLHRGATVGHDQGVCECHRQGFEDIESESD